MATIVTSLRYLCRRWRRRPLVAIAAISVLAFGIGASTSTYQILDAVFFRQSPLPNPERLAVIHAVRADQRSNPTFASTWNRSPISWSSWRHLRESPAFEAVGVWMAQQQIVGIDRLDVACVYFASSSWFSVLGVKPEMGRLFDATDDETENDSVIISYEAWHKRFGGRPDVIGQTTALATTARSSSQSKHVVGVLPAGFVFQGQTPEFILPAGLMAYNGSFDTNRFLRAVARMAPGISLPQAEAIAIPLVRGDEPPERRGARVISLADDRFGVVTPSLWLLLASAGILLTISCASVAGLLLVDGRTRRDEMSIRVSLGATRATLARQLTVEYVALAAIAGLAGAMLASWFTPTLIAMAPAVIRDLPARTLDLRTLGGAVAMSFVALLVFGLVPALRLSATPARSTLAHATTRSQGHRILVAMQLAMAFVLVVAAGLCGQTLLRLRADLHTFDTAGLTVTTIKPRWVPTPQLPAGERRGRRYFDYLKLDDTLKRLANLRAVTSVAGVSVAPFAGIAPSVTLLEVGGPQDPHVVQRRDVTEDYFRTLGIRLLAGRSFVSSDRDRGVPYWIVVSKALARQLSVGNAIGTRLMWSGSPLEIVGVVEDVQPDRFSTEDIPAFYSINFTADQINYLLVRTSGAEADVMPGIRPTLTASDPSLQVMGTVPMSDLMSESMASERFLTFMSTTFGFLAMLLSAIGLFGLINHLVASRRREIAVRLALGASVTAIRRLVLHDVGVIVGGGLVLGAPLAFAAMQILKSQFFGASAVPTGVIIGSLVTFATATLIAIAGPMIRAGRVDAVLALRE